MNPIAKAVPRFRWTTEKVNAAKSEIKALLSTAKMNQVPEKRLAECFRLINHFQSNSSGEAHLRLFVAVVSTLFHHAKYGGLGGTQVAQLKDLAIGILHLVGVQQEGSPLSYLYAEVYSAASQIFWQDGQHWQSMWEQYLAWRSALHSHKSSGIDDAFYQYGMAARLLRSGDLTLALEMAEAAENLPMNEDIKARLLVLRLRILRLSGRPKDFQRTLKLAKEAPLPDSHRLELDWEVACMGATAQFDLSQMRRCIHTKSGHFGTPAYIVEWILWELCLASKDRAAQIPKLSTIKRSKKIARTRVNPLLSVAQAIQDSYDSDLSLSVRLEAMGKLLGAVDKLTAVDHELLCWLAAARAIQSMQLRDAALISVCLSRYKSLSLRLTSGKSKDGLGLAGDLLTKA